MPLFAGRVENNLDQQNRLFLPAKFRERLGETFYMYLPVNKDVHCVTLCTEERLEEVYQELAEESEGNIKEYKKAKRSLNNNLEEISADKQGRISLKANFCERAQLVKTARIIGVGNEVEIWNPEVFDAEIDNDDFSNFS